MFSAALSLTQDVSGFGPNLGLEGDTNPSRCDDNHSCTETRTRAHTHTHTCVSRMRDFANPHISRMLSPAAGQTHQTEIKFTHGDATDLSVKDWSDGDVLFANSTCFDDTLMKKVAASAVTLKKGAIFITFTRRLPSQHFEVLEHQMYQMSWGGATVYIQQKTTDPEPFLEEQDERDDCSTASAQSVG